MKNWKLSKNFGFKEFSNMISQHFPHWVLYRLYRSAHCRDYFGLHSCTCLPRPSAPFLLHCLLPTLLEPTEKGAHISRSIKFPCSFCATFLWQQRELWPVNGNGPLVESTFQHLPAYHPAQPLTPSWLEISLASSGEFNSHWLHFERRIALHFK